MNLLASGPGCIQQIESDFPFGTHVVSCTADVQSIDPLNRGSVCADDGGIDACDPTVAIEAATWGAIKDQYR